jgi:drug/metabolite transporter (DMT)-like permease
VGDFCGGLISRRATVLTAIFVSMGLGLAASAVLVVVGGQLAPAAIDLAWAGLAGLVGFVGLAAFYAALARGTMGVVAPLAALIGAGVPVAVAMAFGEQIGPLRLVGLGVGLLAVVLTSLPSHPRTAHEKRALRVDLAELPMVVVAGLGFAGFFLALDRALSDGADIWWSLAAVRLAGLAAALVLLGGLLVARRSGRLGRRPSDLFRLSGVRQLGWAGALLLLVATGLGDLGGNGFFALARGVDLLSVAVVLSSLYPVITTLLAALLLHERMSRLQLAGIGLAVLSVVLISVR